MPPDWTFLEVMDVFYKIHRVLNIEYHVHIKPMMHFIDRFIYKNNDKGSKITPKMHEVYAKISD